MARKKRSPPSSPISIGNCKLEIDGDRCSCEPIDDGFLISVVKGAKIKISVDDSRKSCDVSLQANDTGKKCFPSEGYSFAIVNPRDEESSSQMLLQEVLKIYTEQLPAMKYAANTGKETYFLEKCISGGKYMTLILKSDNTKGMGNIVEELGGSVTCNGSSSTHVITGKTRRTLNFCIALCSGAWIVSPNWLKASFREGKFLDESPFILEDEDYLLKYKFELKDAVARARLNPNSLLGGYNICVAKHIQPSAVVLSAIIKAAGGNVLRKLEGIREPVRAIFLACEEDMEDAMVAARKGMWTFSSDWFMNCVIKQELDMEAPQFTESL